LALLIAIIAITSSGGGDDASTPADQADGAGGSSQADAPSNKATNDHTPHVGANGSVIVDTLTWRISGAYTAPTIGENQFATETADGVYVAVALSVTNGKEESVTLQGGMITLAAGSSRYESDSEGTFAASIDGEETFFLKDLGPAVSTNGTVVFDVAPAALQRRPEICFGELGFGSSEGCIRLVV
jgi:hypothetical protein